jgi:formamidopyrimidine-DNA glycosylase
VPELPEVETLRRGLEQEVSGHRILGVSVANRKVLKGQSEAEFRDRAVGKRIQGAHRRGKYLLMPLLADDSPTPSLTLYFHLKMRGSVRLQTATEPVGSYHCLSLLLEGDQALRYYDMWCWGEWLAVATGETVPVPLLGEDPLTAEWGAETLARGLVRTRAAIKTVLLNQSVVAGVGNIYADEALFRARVAPQRPANGLTSGERVRLAEAIRTVLAEAVVAGGSKGDYVNLFGQPGSYAPQVYDCEGKPCPQCGAPLEKVRLGGRGTTFCPHCQN